MIGDLKLLSKGDCKEMGQVYAETAGNQNKKVKVLMYYSCGNMIGGPVTYINTIMNSDLKNKYTFSTCYQNKAPKGLNLKLLREMVKKIKEEKPDIVHVHGAQSEGFYGGLAAKLAGCKNIVMTIHGFAFDSSQCRGLKYFLYKYIIEPISIKMATKVYCVCEFASKRKIVVKNVGDRNCGYIHNAVSELIPVESRGDIRKRYQIKNTDVLFCIAARISRDKGFDVLAKTIKILNQKGIQNFKMMVLGDGAYTEEFCGELKEEIATGQVIMIGRTNQVANYLFASDAFVFPSYHENLSIALLEACMAGLACIVSDVGGNSEIVKNGETGFVVENADPRVYADKMETLIKDKELLYRMQVEARRDVQTRFSVVQMCEKIDEVYTSVIYKK